MSDTNDIDLRNKFIEFAQDHLRIEIERNSDGIEVRLVYVDHDGKRHQIDRDWDSI
jgi:hypothetical protein